MTSSAYKEEIAVAEKESQMENQENREEIVSVELAAPIGWKKKFTPKKGGTPRRNEIVFISPTGEEIKSKRQLDQFLKSHPGGPSSSEFDWGTGDTRRRSARISEKSKATETPEREPPKKRERKSSSKKGEKEKKDSDDEAAEEEEAVDAAAATAEETKASVDVEMKEAEGLGDKNEEVIATGEAVSVEDTVKDTQQKSEEKVDELNMEKSEDQEANNKTVSDTKEELAEYEVPPPSSMPNEEVKAVEEAKAGEETSMEKEAKLGERLTENSSLKESQEDKEPTETHSINCEKAQHQPKTSSVSC